MSNAHISRIFSRLDSLCNEVLEDTKSDVPPIVLIEICTLMLEECSWRLCYQYNHVLFPLFSFWKNGSSRFKNQFQNMFTAIPYSTPEERIDELAVRPGFYFRMKKFTPFFFARLKLMVLYISSICWKNSCWSGTYVRSTLMNLPSSQ